MVAQAQAPGHGAQGAARRSAAVLTGVACPKLDGEQDQVYLIYGQVRKVLQGRGTGASSGLLLDTIMFDVDVRHARLGALLQFRLYCHMSRWSVRPPTPRQAPAWEPGPGLVP
jgi:hypothetical protein